MKLSLSYSTSRKYTKIPLFKESDGKIISQYNLYFRKEKKDETQNIIFLTKWKVKHVIAAIRLLIYEFNFFLILSLLNRLDVGAHKAN